MSTPITSSTATTILSSQGVGSGLDIASIVSALTTSKAAPLTNALNRSNTAVNAQVSAFGTFNSALATFQATLATLKDPTQLAGRTAALGDVAIATATADSSAVPGQYSLEVNNLATAASLSSKPIPGGADAIVGTGLLLISVGGQSSQISIGDGENTLQGIAAAINSAPNNPGVSASILTTSDGARLVLTGTKTGKANAITVTTLGGDDGLSVLTTTGNLVATSVDSLSSKPYLGDASATVGTGTLLISLGGQSSTITIGATNNTLQGIADAINNASDNPGVHASIDTSTTLGAARLVLTDTKTGDANAITVTQSGVDNGLGALTTTSNLVEDQKPQDATFTVNGYAATSASNQVTSVISGVTLNLLKTTVAKTDTTAAVPTTLTVGADTAGAQTSIGTFVKALNGLMSSLKSLSSYDPVTQTAGPLLGNATVQAFQNKLSKILGQVNSGITSGPNSLAALGIGFNVAGTYSSDSAKIGNALTANLASVSKLLSGPDGIATQIDTMVTQYTQAGGLLDTISNAFKSTLSDNAKQLEALTARMTVYTATLTAQYNAMDAAVALLKQTQSFLTQQFNPPKTTT